MESIARLPAYPGETFLGTYRIERVLGEGGMGTVVSARHLRLDERVAIKFRKVDRPGSTERFLQEGRVAAKLRSEHVARVFDVGECEGTVYLVMEYLEGRTLGALLHEVGRVEPAVAVEYLLQACEAVAEAHRYGVVHRDIKLDNLFLTKTADGRPSIKLLDFGVSKVASLELTDSAAIVGSPIYMAPEQLESSKDVDARADIWSLGVVLFVLLTGEQPFAGETLPQLCVAIREGRAPTLAEHGLVAQAELERIVARCLEKDPAKRFRTVSELARALGNVGGPDGVAYARRVSRMLEPHEAETLDPEAKRRAPVPFEASDVSVSVAASPSARRRLWPIAIVIVIAASIALGVIATWHARTPAAYVAATGSAASSVPVEPPPPPSSAPIAPSSARIPVAPKDASAPRPQSTVLPLPPDDRR